MANRTDFKDVEKVTKDIFRVLTYTLLKMAL